MNLAHIIQQQQQQQQQQPQRRKVPYRHRLNFPNTPDNKQWVYYLRRRLTNPEKCILWNFYSENDMNTAITNIATITSRNNLCIPMLSNLVGDCLFESLQYHKIWDADLSVADFRKSLGYLMYIFRDCALLDTRTMKQAFTDTNEIEYVVGNDKVLYKYNYNIMCQDLAGGGNWSRLPTELTLRFLSKILNLEIHIYNDNSEYIHIIKQNDATDQTRIIYLGHMGEYHYIPIDVQPENWNINNTPYYTESYKTFTKWAVQQYKFINHEVINRVALEKNVEFVFPTEDGYLELFKASIQRE